MLALSIYAHMCICLDLHIYLYVYVYIYLACNIYVITFCPPQINYHPYYVDKEIVPQRPPVTILTSLSSYT